MPSKAHKLSTSGPFTAPPCPGKFPHLEVANGHAILWLGDKSEYPFLREIEVVNPLKAGLPDVNRWSPYNDDIVGIEGPVGTDEEGLPCCRAWVYTHGDKAPRCDVIPDSAVDPASIAPGKPSRHYCADGDV